MDNLLNKTNGIGNGKYTKKVQFMFEQRYNINKVLLTTSCTDALELAAMVCDFDYGDEIIMPSYTFVSTANAFVIQGCKPVFVDIDSRTLNIRTDLIEEAITPRTKAIVPVHYNSVSCNMEELMRIAKKYNLLVIEDAAQCIDSTFNDKQLGTFGDFGCMSFHGTKNFSCGEGGALFINNKKFIEKAEMAWDKGTDRLKNPSNYTWQCKGSSFQISDYLAYILFKKFKNIIRYNLSRITKNYRYWHYFTRLDLNEDSVHNYINICTFSMRKSFPNGHFFFIILEDTTNRDKIIEKINSKSKNIKVSSHYHPLHLSNYGKQFGNYYLPTTEWASNGIIRFPTDESINIDEIKNVVKIAKEVIINESFVHIPRS